MDRSALQRCLLVPGFARSEVRAGAGAVNFGEQGDDRPEDGAPVAAH